MQSEGRGPVIVLRGLTSVVIVLRQCLEISSMEVELFVLDEINCSVDFALQWQSVEKNFSSVVSREFYNTFVLVRDSGLCLFMEKSLRRNNPSLVQANCIKSLGFRLQAI